MFSTEAIYQQSYLTIPRSVFCDESLSLEAMVLYGFLLDRTKLSERNRLQDEQGLFVFCTIEEACKVLRAGRCKVMQVFEELVEKKMLFRFRQGQRKANKYYIVLPSEVRDSDVCDSDILNSDILNSDISNSDVLKSDPLKSEIQTQEVCKTDPSNNEPTNNDISHNENIKSSPVFCQSEKQFLMKAKLDIRYFTRRAAGEDVALLDQEAYERYLQIKQTPPH